MFSSAYRSISHIYNRPPLVNLSTSVFLKSYNDVRTSRIMNKFLKKSSSKKKKFYALPFGGAPQELGFVANDKNSHKSDRRLNVLNKVFMKYITDLMSTGELCPKISGRGIQISKVKVTPTFHQVNVHWLANGNDLDTETENLLSEFAPKLRHELSQLRIMGAVPKIEFIKDSSYLKYMVVESILKTADYGDDFEPTPLANDWKSDGDLKPKISSDVKDVSKEQESATDVGLPLPVMRMDTFGLNHEAIMKRINQSVQRAKAAHRRDLSLIISVDDVSKTNKTASILNSKERKKLLRDFVLKKKLEWKKSLNKEKKCRPELVIMGQETESKLVDGYLKYDDEEDYSEEFDRSSYHLEDDYSRT